MTRHPDSPESPPAPPDWRAALRAGLAGLVAAPPEALAGRASDLLDPAVAWDCAAPIDRLDGPAAVVAGWLGPLRAAFAHVQRRDLMFLGGRNIRANGGDWVACITHYVGTFAAPFCGLAPTGRLAFLRAGEFYRVEAGRIVEAKVLFDLPDLMRQAGRFPLPREHGTEMAFPAPATQDGLCPGRPERSSASLAVVERMLGDLHLFRPGSFASEGQTGAEGTWAEDMLWYGPGGIGATYRWEGFVADHRASFLTAFPDRKGGNHYCRIGDGDYAAVSGWPSMTMTHLGPYLGSPPSGRAMTLRVMDFYRCTHGETGSRIAENWVCLDYMDLARQMGRDLVAEANALPPPR